MSNTQVSLPKWPGMLVLGDNVTLDQAAEIIIRTNYFPFCTNNHTFNRMYTRMLFGIDKVYYDLTSEDNSVIEEKCKEYGILPIYYLCNAQILSSWVGGPHGWCKWDGQIKTSCYNIGKWPSIETVYEEWKLIAQTFPFLKLKCQLLNGEICEHDEKELKPLVEYIVENGDVTINYNPKELILEPTDYGFNIFDENREVGCDVQQFVKAIQTIKK